MIRALLARRHRFVRAAEPLRGVPYAVGGVVSPSDRDPDMLPCFISPGRSTTLRPGETILEATERLMEGEDL